MQRIAINGFGRIGRNVYAPGSKAQNNFILKSWRLTI